MAAVDSLQSAFTTEREDPPSSKRILLIEDNLDGREMLRLVLQFWGHEVEVAEDGRRGVDKALAWKPNIAVIDIGLPVMDGYQVAEELRRTFRDQIVLIALTAYAQPDDRRHALEAGFNAHMTKPADLNELHRLLAGL